ncbi:ankyrin [Coccomyxa subellipsoidea C-169]|uniref:Ankyrin n=1 Tax=Coccomyxa subellipsoidea (strain C-169) TaxID=574566 RepID=I0YVL1_COCSC|nr:ankyrin [Coccomyxa subellipsoidea C-169]EIE22430.1 ankyrin [Coccomyxa subellipsoidea C-169]|eukprot:XP_005646974.1 ankyrin [Coccomyxa subellipsoidea C-169]
MPRDLTACGRYPPQPLHKPIAFYSCARLGDPDQLAKIVATDPYFITQDNGAGAPLHFATTYKQLDMVHHLLNNGAEINQRDEKGFTPLHRAAYLSHYDGYLEIYEYLLSRGADPSIRTENYDPYLSPGKKLPIDVALDDDEIRSKLRALDKKYAKVKKVREPHPDIGCWWTLYDYGLDAIKKWDKEYKHPYPGESHPRDVHIRPCKLKTNMHWEKAHPSHKQT